MLQPAGFIISCLLLRLISSAPLSSDADSSSDEDLQLPVVFPAVGVASPQTPPGPPGVILEVEDMKTNITLSFAIFIIAEEETEGSGTDGRGRSDDNSSSSEMIGDLSSEETTPQDVHPMASLDGHVITTDEENLSSEEMMSDQPMFDDFNNTTFSTNTWNHQPSDDFDSFINTLFSNVSQTVSDDFNNSSESIELHTQPTITAEINANLQGDALTKDTRSTSSSLQEVFGSNTEDKPESQEATSSSSEKTSSVIQSRVGFGSRLQEVFRSFQEVVDQLSGKQEVMEVKGSHHKVFGSDPNSLTGNQRGFILSSDESDESLETFSKISSDPKNQSLKVLSSSVQEVTGSTDSTQQTPKTSSMSPDPDRKEVQDTSALSIRVDNPAGLNPDSPDQDGAPTMLGIPKGTMLQINNKDRARPISQVSVGLDPDSSEEVVGSRVSSPEVSSSSEEVALTAVSSSSPLLVSSAVPSNQGQTVSEGFSSESEESDSSLSGSKSDPPGLELKNNSQSAELHPDPIPTSDSDLSPQSNYEPSLGMNFSSRSEISQRESEEPEISQRESEEPEISQRESEEPEISQKESEEPEISHKSDGSPTTRSPTGASSDATRGANPTENSSEANVDTKLDSSVKDTEADLSLETTTDSNNDDFSISDTVYSTNIPSMHVSSDANTDSGNRLSVEEDDANTEATADSIKPTITTEFTTNPLSSRASTDANTDIEANPGVGPNHMAPPPPPPPPRRKRPYRFGFLGPISHSYGNQLVAMETVSKEGASSSDTLGRETLAVHVYSDPVRRVFNLQHDVNRERHLQAVDGSNRKQMKVRAAAQSSSEEENQ